MLVEWPNASWNDNEIITKLKIFKVYKVWGTLAMQTCSFSLRCLYQRNSWIFYWHYKGLNNQTNTVQMEEGGLGQSEGLTQQRRGNSGSSFPLDLRQPLSPLSCAPPFPVFPSFPFLLFTAGEEQPFWVREVQAFSYKERCDSEPPTSLYCYSALFTVSSCSLLVIIHGSGCWSKYL